MCEQPHKQRRASHTVTGSSRQWARGVLGPILQLRFGEAE